MNIPLTNRQQNVYDYLKQVIKDKGYPPSVREICENVGLSSTSSVHAHLETLEKKGYIKRSKAKNRCIEVLENDFYNTQIEITRVPIIGNVAAGVPIFADENIEDYFPIPSSIIKNNEVFFLRVQGDSMIEAGIYNNDLVLINKQNYAQNGEIVVALIEDSATLKTFYKEKNHIRLQPENSSYEPILVREVNILGTLKALYRNYV